MTTATSGATEAEGRPSGGALLAAEIMAGKDKREKSRDLRPLRRLVPLVLAHWRLAVLSILFLLLSTGATLGVTSALRIAVDHGFGIGDFFVALGVSLGLAFATAARFYCVTRLGERVIADLRRNVYSHVLTLDQAWFMQVRTGEVLSRMTGETLDQLETVQAFGREGFAARRFAESVEAAFEASVARVGARAIMTAMVISLVTAGIAAVLWLGVTLVHAHEMSNGQILQFLFLAVLAAGSVGVLGEVWGEVQKASGAMSRIDEILTAKPSIAAPDKPKPLPRPASGAISFADVRFAYPGRSDLPALNGLTFSVRPGETVALVGPSGAGKSTVLRLLLRFYDPQSGIIALDGVDLRDADPAEVRARMALVAQDASLFSGSALDNIRFGREAATRAEIEQAASASEAAGFISALPDGFDQSLGERGKTLSGGQRQRIAIARALVRDAPILLLDEATSALDAENERLVQLALSKAMTGRTTLVIAHRLATVQNADRIVVMDGGVVVEEGRHAELIARGGLYAHLAELQFGAAPIHPDVPVVEQAQG